MNKVFYLLITVIFTVSSLAAQKMHEGEDPFMNYYNEQTTGNLIEAINYFSNQDGTEQGLDSRIKLSNLYMIAMENELNSLAAELDSLTMMNKFQYANLLLGLKRYDEAIPIYEELNASAPAWSCPWRHKGEAYFKSSHLEDAETALEKAIETRVEHYDAYVMMADVKNEMGKYKEALETLETGFSYLGEDIEDPAEEVDDLDVKFLYLDLLRKNDRQEEYKELKMKLQKIAPEDKRLAEGM